MATFALHTIWFIVYRCVFAVLYFSDNVQKEEEEWLLQSSLDEGSVCEGEEQGLVRNMQSRQQ